MVGGGVEGCVRSQGESDCEAGGKSRVEAKGRCIRVEGEFVKDMVYVVLFVAC